QITRKIEIGLFSIRATFEIICVRHQIEACCWNRQTDDEQEAGPLNAMKCRTTGIDSTSWGIPIHPLVWQQGLIRQRVHDEPIEHEQPQPDESKPTNTAPRPFLIAVIKDKPRAVPDNQ